MRAGNLSLHRLIDGYSLRPANHRRIHRGDVGSNLPLLGRGSCSGDDYLAEVHGADVERDVDGGRSERNGHCLDRRLITDAADGERSRADGDSNERVFPVRTGHGADARAGDEDLDVGKASADGRVGYSSTHGTSRLLSVRNNRQKEGEREKQRAASYESERHQRFSDSREP